MRISELADATGVPVHTLKFYLREGVLMPGAATSRTRAEYGPQHVDRVALLRALIEHGGVSVRAVRAIVDALDSPSPSRHELLGVAHRVVPGGADHHDVLPDVGAVLADLGWRVWPDGPFLAALSDAVRAARAAGVALTADTLGRYARAMLAVAETDVGVALETEDPAEQLRTVVVGTVMVDPVLTALRRVAQEVASARWEDRRGDAASTRPP